MRRPKEGRSYCDWVVGERTAANWKSNEWSPPANKQSFNFLSSSKAVVMESKDDFESSSQQKIARYANEICFLAADHPSMHV
ncbi:hypothetical protein ACLOJK_008927 [Asimina triloba]